jgi:hypothetical protein
MILVGLKKEVDNAFAWGKHSKCPLPQLWYLLSFAEAYNPIPQEYTL